jgi:hypothetical protein
MSNHKSTVSYGSSILLRMVGLRDNQGNYQNNATVRLLSFTQRAGGAVAGISYPLALTYVPASNGNYQVELPAGINLLAGRIYVAILEATGSQGYVKQWTELVKVVRASN